MSAKQIYVNLSAKDLPKSRAFFAELGFSFNAQYSSEQTACVIVSEHIYIILLSEEHFKQFAPKAICDTSVGNEALLCLSCESREQVDDLVQKALRAGGSTHKPPQEYGFMYGHGFQDLDGHVWELIHLVPQKAEA